MPSMMALLATPLLKTNLAMATVTETTTTCMMMTQKVMKIWLVKK